MFLLGQRTSELWCLSQYLFREVFDA